MLVGDAKWRKAHPVFSGVLRYFPDALVELAHVSKVGNDQHNPGSPLHWDRSKSQDEFDALTRHLLDAGDVDEDGIRHTAKMAWRALAALQKEIEQSRIDEARDQAMIRKAVEGLNARPVASGYEEECGDPDCCCHEMTKSEQMGAAPGVLLELLPTASTPDALEEQKLFDDAFEERKKFLSRSNSHG